MRLAAAALLCAALFFCAPADCFAQLAGRAFSFVPDDSAGACSFPPASSASFGAAGEVALSPNSSLALGTSPLGGCGTCIELAPVCGDGPGAACTTVAPVVGVVTSSCSTCAPTDVSLSLEMYQRLGGTQAGSLPVTYRAVECAPPANASLAVLAYRESEGGYLRLALTGVAGARGIASVELRQTPLVAGHLDIVASTWRRMHNEFGGAWEVSGAPAPPLDLRIADGTGRQILARSAILVAGKVGVFPTRAQFPPTNSSASVAAAGIAALALPEMASALEAPALPAADGAALPPLAVGEGAVQWLPLELAPETDTAEAPAPVSAAWPADGSQCTTILGVLASRRSFNMLLALIRTAGLEDALGDPSTPPLTLFAPDNRAWAVAVAQLPLLKYNPDMLRDVILQHVLPSPKRAADFTAQASHYDTLGGGYLTIKSSSPAAPLTALAGPDAAPPRLLVVSQASAAATTNATDLPACSSVVHGVNAVLLPQMARRRA